MVRAILTNGVIKPLDPFPAGWKDGETLRIESTKDSGQPGTYDSAEVAGSDITMKDYEALRHALDEYRSEQKEFVRQRKGHL